MVEVALPRSINIEETSVPTVNDLRNGIVNRWGVIGGVTGVAIGLGGSLLGVEYLSGVTNIKELTEPLLKASILTVSTLFSGIIGAAAGLDPIGKLRADAAYPIPKPYYHRATYEEFVGTNRGS